MHSDANLISHKTECHHGQSLEKFILWAHVSVQLKIGALMLGAFPAPKALPGDQRADKKQEVFYDNYILNLTLKKRFDIDALRSNFLLPLSKFPAPCFLT